MSRSGSPPLQRHSEGPALLGDTCPFRDASQARVRRRDRFLAWGFSAGVHLTVLVALFWPHAEPPSSSARPPPSPIMISLAELPKPNLPGPPDAVRVEAPEIAVRPIPPRAIAPVLAIITPPMPDNSDLMSESELAGAASAGGGDGGGGAGGCDMARAVQQALQRDPLVRAAVEDANRLGKAIMVWNGDWVRSGGQDGKGLSAAREAIMWEVAFAPEACRNQRMHGLILLSLADGRTRFAIGSGDWRWSDLLGVRGTPAAR